MGTIHFPAPPPPPVEPPKIPGSIISIIGGVLDIALPVLGTILSLLSASSLKAFAHDVTLSLKLSWNAIAWPIFEAIKLIKEHILDLISRLKKLYDYLKDKIGKIIGPIIKYQKQIRDLWDHLFNRFIAPILQTIQHLRQTLTIFKVFHVKFADALDKRLAGLEGDIASRFLIVKQTINKTLSWLELIADPEGLLKTIPIYQAILKATAGLGAVIRGFTWKKPPPNFMANRLQYERDLTDDGFREASLRILSNQMRPDEAEFRDNMKKMLTP